MMNAEPLCKTLKVYIRTGTIRRNSDGMFLGKIEDKIFAKIENETLNPWDCTNNILDGYSTGKRKLTVKPFWWQIEELMVADHWMEIASGQNIIDPSRNGETKLYIDGSWVDG